MNENKAINIAPENITLRLLKRTGGYYPLLVIALAQIISFAGMGIGGIIIRVNAQLTDEQISRSGIMAFSLVFIGNIIVLIGAYFFNKEAREQLDAWANSEPNEGGQSEIDAWHQITSIAWRFGITTAFVSTFIENIPLILYQHYFLGTTSDQIIYCILGSSATSIGSILIAILVIEYLLAPAREILLPVAFELQLVGVSGLRLGPKLLVVFLALIILSIIVVAPIGYQKTTQALYENVNSAQVLRELQLNSIISSMAVILLVAIITFLLSRSISNPLSQLIDTFSKVEKGDLQQRAKVLSTDEVGELALYFNRMISRLDGLQQNMEKLVDDRTQQLRVSNEVGRIASTILDPDIVITRVVNLIAKSFGYYYAAIFLVGENGRWAVLKDATGSAGEILRARRHRLQINNTSMVGAAISTQEAQVALDVGDSAVRFNNPLLPNTRSEVAVPLLVGDRVIGALDVQSIREADFKPEDLSTLQSMANQVAISIENARLFKEMDLALEELRLSNREYISSAWEEKMKSGALEYVTKGSSQESDEDTKEVEVNLNLRDEHIGRIRIKTDTDWSEEDQAWVEALATQVAISLENARLVEESQQSALRERLSASIVQKLWSSSSIDGILQTAVRELGRALEASEATIELSVDE